MAKRQKTVPMCPNPLDRKYLAYVERLGKAIAAADWRPEPSKASVKRWDDYIRCWAANKRRPLFIRRRTAGRGSVIEHETGRLLIPVDNSTAHWVYRAVLENRSPPKRLNLDTIPVAMAFMKEERQNAQYTTIGGKTRLNNEGWKLCHIQDVKLGHGKLHEISMERLQAHFIRFLSPSNMFVAPLSQQGVGELDEVKQAMSDQRSRAPRASQQGGRSSF